MLFRSGVPAHRPLDTGCHCVCECESTLKDERDQVYSWIVGLVIVQVTSLLGWAARSVCGYLWQARRERSAPGVLALPSGGETSSPTNAELARLQLEALRRR